MKIKPDIDFIREIKQDSRSNLKECMQCGNCSVVCDLSPEANPFPRKEMIWSAWGLKDKIVSNPDIWLCHQCGDCSVHCPRGVKPSDVLSSLRNYTIKHYSRPAFLTKICNKPALVPLAIIIPSVIILLILWTAGTLQIPDGPINYSAFFPHVYLNVSFTALVLLVIGFNISGFRKFWTDMNKHFHPDENTRKTSIGSFINVFFEILNHDNFRKCKTARYRNSAHIFVFTGFAMLLVVTLFAIAATVTGNYPMPFSHPVKIAGNIAAVLLLTGILIMISQRLIDKKAAGNTSYPDWFFLISFFLLTLSGVFVELARLRNWGFAYHIYFFHLLTVWLVIIYAPYTKFGHFIYRTLAMLSARSKGRKLGL